MKLIPRQKIWLAIIVVANLTLWIIPSNVVELIARGHDVLLGRYSRQHFTTIFLVALISAISLYIDWSTGEKYKRRWFTVLASLGMMLPLLALADFLMRTGAIEHYVLDTLAYHRPAFFKIEDTVDHLPAAVREELHGGVFRDRPKARRSYPDAPEGYPPIPIRYHADKRGFRNATDLERYDIVVLGDSFAEGSSVSDEHPWPVRLAQRTGRTVYNLGMSGYAPANYLAALDEYGLSLSPSVVLCMIYEGNDFRSARSMEKEIRPSASKRFKRYMKQSPILTRFDRSIINVFGPMRADAPVRGIEVLSWMPVALPEGPAAHYYAFAPKQLLSMKHTQLEFEASKYWAPARDALSKMHARCVERGIEFAVVYAPQKSHVVMPAVWDRLDADQVRAFCALRADELPEAGSLMSRMRVATGAKEAVVTRWCREAGVTLIATTETLRTAAVSGTQVYFTYDQHWTPDGHQVVADAVADFLVGDLADAPVAREAPAPDTP